MLEPDQLQELNRRLEAIAGKHQGESDEMVRDLRNDLKLIMDMYDSPEKTALEQRFLQGLLYAEKSVSRD